MHSSNKQTTNLKDNLDLFPKLRNDGTTSALSDTALWWLLEGYITALLHLDCIVSHGGMRYGRILKKAVTVSPRHSPGIYLAGIDKSATSLSQDSQCPI
jgi:hypothetical protein